MLDFEFHGVEFLIFDNSIFHVQLCAIALNFTLLIIKILGLSEIKLENRDHTLTTAYQNISAACLKSMIISDSKTTKIFA